jgi:hypothetical protein
MEEDLPQQTKICEPPPTHLEPPIGKGKGHFVMNNSIPYVQGRRKEEKKEEGRKKKKKKRRRKEEKKEKKKRKEEEGVPFLFFLFFFLFLSVAHLQPVLRGDRAGRISQGQATLCQGRGRGRGRKNKVLQRRRETTVTTLRAVVGSGLALVAQEVSRPGIPLCSHQSSPPPLFFVIVYMDIYINMEKIYNYLCMYTSICDHGDGILRKARQYRHEQLERNIRKEGKATWYQTK